MTAYVLLAHLTTLPAPSQEELSLASLIAKWIIGQQNPSGGFSSTQVSCFPPAASHISVSRQKCQRCSWGPRQICQGRDCSLAVEPCSSSPGCRGAKGPAQQEVPLGTTTLWLMTCFA